MTPPPPGPADPYATPGYPGGENHPAYKLAFTVWVVVFLGVLCLGLLNFLGLYVKYHW